MYARGRTSCAMYAVHGGVEEGGEEGELSSRSGDSFTFAYSIQHKHTTFGEGVGNFATLDWNRPAYRRARISALMLTFPVKCAASAVALQ